ESHAHFAATKADRFRTLADHPAVLREVTGLDSFLVLVTVTCEDADARIEALRQLVRGRIASPLFRFMRADRLLASPGTALSETQTWDRPSQPAFDVPLFVAQPPEIQHLDTVLPPPGWEPGPLH